MAQMPKSRELKSILDNLDITLLNIEFYTVGTEWNYQNVNNPYSRIYYITKGYGQIIHHDREYTLLPDHLYLIPCFTTVNLYCPKQFSHYYIHFTSRIPSGLDILSIFRCNYQASASDCRIGPAVLDRLIELNPGKELIDYDANKPIYGQLVDRAIQQDRDKPPANILETNALLRILLSVFFREYDQPHTSNTLHGLTRFDTVLDYIEDNLGASLKIESLAKIANLNPTYFSNLFSNLLGISPIQYINKRRVQEAQKLLLSTDHTLYHIARQVGFSDEYYLSRVFKKFVGIAPDRYRKQAILNHLR